MQRYKVNIILDAQWGSSGKGKFAAWLADRHDVTLASASNAPNAGHTVVKDGWRYIFKCLPAASIEPSVCKVMLTGASVFDAKQLLLESAWAYGTILIHDRAIVLQPRHREQEASSPTLTAIASTQQGSVAAAIEKLMRDPNAIVAAYKGVLWPANVVPAADCRRILQDELDRGGTALHEVSQGYALSIDHGSHFPFCTSRNATTAKGLDDLGISPRELGDVYLNVRPYPIRVGNIVRDDETVGCSGGFYPDCVEISWETVGKLADMPDDEIQKLYQAELTTVTKRLRRVCTFSQVGFVDAVRTNGATKIILNFAQYLDWSFHETRGSIRVIDMPHRVREFVWMLEELSGCPVVAIGTGADHHDVVIPKRR